MADQATFGNFLQRAGNDMAAAQRAEERVLATIDRLGLRDHVSELEAKGYTILPPERVAAPGLAEAARDQVLAAIERKRSVTADLDTGLGKIVHQGEHCEDAAMAVRSSEETITIPGILFEDPIFETALMNGAMLALITYMLGESCHLSFMAGIAKMQGEHHLALHVDKAGDPSPLSPYPHVANATLLLTDYSPEKGSTCFVEGSHLFCRPPSASEATDVSLFKPISASAGSVLIWGGNTWHGAVPRKVPGLRVGLLMLFARWFLYKGEDNMAARVTPAMLARNACRFGRLTGVEAITATAKKMDAPTIGRAALSRFA